LPKVHCYFTSSEEEVNEAKEMLRLADEAQKEEKGVAVMNGKFIGPPMVRNAKNILNKISLVKK
jgi:citrate lyase subunit beta/citryl-CoA lyase